MTRASASLAGLLVRAARADFLFALIGVCVLGFWGWELRHTILELREQEETVLRNHQQGVLDKKGEEFRDFFNSLYQAGRTIALLPMVRDVKGGNRLSATEDVVHQGRFSVDAHRTVQQIYGNLRASTDISEIYYVLLDFRPDRGEVPFFMYDDAIATDRPKNREEIDHDMPAEVEDFEYQYFGKQLRWFQERAPILDQEQSINRIPAIVSPLMRTCDNTQFTSERHGNPRDVSGLLYSVPVYERSTDALKGLISIIVRANVLEARLIGVPFLPVTEADRKKVTAMALVMPPPSAFVLRNRLYGIEIADRRSPLAGQGATGGRSASLDIDAPSDGVWTLTHQLTAAEVDALVAPIGKKRIAAVAGRLMLLTLLVALGGWAFRSLQRWRREMAWLAQHDALTALPNRRLFFSRLEEALARARRGKLHVGLFFIDIKDFSAINDTLGHQGGDKLLVEVARRLRDPLRATDSVVKLPPGNLIPKSTTSRLGGDEFAIILDSMVSATDVGPLAERVLDTFKEPLRVGKDEVEVAVSMGIAVFPDDAQDAEHLLLSADSARAQCRQEGTPYRLFNEEMRRQVERQHQLSVELQMAMQRHQFELFYQPKQSLRDGRVISFEALLRWRHSTLGMISPAEFIPLLERSGLIVAVGEWVLQDACRGLQAMQAAGFTDLHISANVSVRQLRRGNFAEVVGGVLTGSGVDPARVILEVTESMVMDNLAEGVVGLQALKELGVKLAIDDFGTGYSSLTYLQYLPIDYLKLDKSFIDGMEAERGRHIVETVIGLARGLSMQTVAEGIEREAQRDMLRAMDCDIIQGYLLARPMPLATAIEWITASRAAGGTAESDA